MKSRNMRNIFMVVLLSMMLGLFVPLSSGATYTYYRENFTNEAKGVNPVSTTGELAYTYAEVGFKTYNAGVNTSFDGEQRLAINATGNYIPVANGWVNFTFNSSSDYDYFDFYFEYLNAYKYRHNHSGISIILAGNVGTILTLKVFGANHSITTQRNKVILLDYNNVEQANESIAKDTWYHVRFTPDYEDAEQGRWEDTLQVTMEAVGGSEVLDHTVDLNGNAELSSVKFHNTPNSGKVCILFDSFTLFKTTYTHGEATTNYLKEYVIPIVFAVAMLVAIATYAMTGGLDPKTLIMLLIALIIGFITLMIVTSV